MYKWSVGIWDEESIMRLRSAAHRRDGLAGLMELRGRPYAPVLQYAGEVLIAALAAGLDEARAMAGKCLTELAARDWPGDAELAHELGRAVEPGRHRDRHDPAGLPAALGGGTGLELAEAPIDLGILGARLGGDAADGPHLVDLITGAIFAAGAWTGPGSGTAGHRGAHDPRTGQDPRRWLELWPQPRAVQHDMLAFVAMLENEPPVAAPAGWCTRLRARAEVGDQAGFRAELRGTPHEFDWDVYRTERARGRARTWLADRGLRAGRR